MNLVKVTVASAIGGLVGAGIWGGISYATNYEIGWIAWGIGALVGILAGVSAGGAADARSGMIAALVSVLAVAGGKYMAIYLTIAKAVDERPAMTQENYISYIADDVIAFWDSEGRAYEWPAGVKPEEAWVKADYPPEVWAEAESAWNSMTDGERAVFMEEFGAVDPFTATSRLYSSSYGMWDILWFGLAVVTAFKLGCGAVGEESGGAAAA